MIQLNWDRLLNLLFAICFASFLIMQVNNFLIKESSLIINIILFIIYMAIIIYVYQTIKED